MPGYIEPSGPGAADTINALLGILNKEALVFAQRAAGPQPINGPAIRQACSKTGVRAPVKYSTALSVGARLARSLAKRS